jgi:adenylate cyclase
MSSQSSNNSSLLESIKQDEVSDSLKDSEILVADANHLTRATLKNSLLELGFTNIIEASSGREAVERLSEKPCDLMVLDMEMPEMNGVEVLEAKNNNPKLKEVPTIVTSTSANMDLAVKGIEAGAEDYLVKPASNTLLRVRVTASLEKKRLREMHRARLQVNRALELARNGLGDMDRLLFERLQEKKELVEIEKAKSEGLLMNILPGTIAGRLKAGEKTIATGHHVVSVMFADLCGFTELSLKTDPADLVTMLNDIFTAFDDTVKNHRVEKIKTIGDCYMVVGGLPDYREDHARALANAALEMIQVLERINKKRGTDLAMRIGIHSGPVVAGVIGKIKLTYDLWGDTVNVASRMESTGIPGRIHISEQTRDELVSHFDLEERGMVECKGLGQVKTFFLKGRS